MLRISAEQYNQYLSRDVPDTRRGPTIAMMGRGPDDLPRELHRMIALRLPPHDYFRKRAFLRRGEKRHRGAFAPWLRDVLLDDSVFRQHLHNYESHDTSDAVRPRLIAKEQELIRLRTPVAGNIPWSREELKKLYRDAEARAALCIRHQRHFPNINAAAQSPNSHVNHFSNITEKKNVFDLKGAWFAYGYTDHQMPVSNRRPPQSYTHGLNLLHLPSDGIIQLQSRSAYAIRAVALSTSLVAYVELRKVRIHRFDNLTLPIAGAHTKDRKSYSIYTAYTQNDTALQYNMNSYIVAIAASGSVVAVLLVRGEYYHIQVTEHTSRTKMTYLRSEEMVMPFPGNEVVFGLYMNTTGGALRIWACFADRMRTQRHLAIRCFNQQARALQIRDLHACFHARVRQLPEPDNTYSNSMHLSPTGFKNQIQMTIYTRVSDHPELMSMHDPRPNDAVRSDILVTLPVISDQGLTYGEIVTLSPNPMQFAWKNTLYGLRVPWSGIVHVTATYAHNDKTRLVSTSGYRQDNQEWADHRIVANDSYVILMVSRGGSNRLFWVMDSDRTL